MKTKTLGLTLLAACSYLACSFAGSPTAWHSSMIPSNTSHDSGLDGKYATGSWGGLRDQLEAQGIDLFASVILIRLAM